MPDARKITRSLAIYAWVLASVGVSALAISWIYYPPVLNVVFGLLVLSVLVAESLAIDLPSAGSTSLAYPLTIATAVLFGPAAAATAAVLGAFTWNDMRRRRAASLTALNVGQLAISASAAGWAFLWLGGRTLVISSAGSWSYTPLAIGDFPSIVIPLLALSLVSILANDLLVSFGVHLYLGVPWAKVLSEDVAWMSSRQLALAAVGVSIAQVLSVSRPAFVLFVVPLVVSRQVFKRYLELREAYVDTVKSLVGAVEAKDPYTRGHSERVARYASCLGRSLRLSQSRLDTLRYAALLHDVGKIGIPMKVLNKPGTLTDDEYGQVKQHPRLGAQVISKVPYLGDIVEAVLYHHEHVDGSGYGQGIKSEQIPLLPRILAIADAYDAMTSERPYRRALTLDEAAAELKRCAGSQFDEEIVLQFVSLLRSGQSELIPGSEGSAQ